MLGKKIRSYSFHCCKVGEAADAGNIAEELRRGQELIYKGIQYQKASLSCYRNPNNDSLEAVGIYKSATDEGDKILIHKINSWNFNAEPWLHL